MSEAAPQLPPAFPCLAGTGWSRRRLIWTAIFLLGAQLGFVFLFGARPPKPKKGSVLGPHLQLARAGDEWVALQDPTLFVLPHPDDFGAPVWQQTPVPADPLLRYSEPPQYLTLAAAELQPPARPLPPAPSANHALDLQPPPALATPALTVAPESQPSTLEVSGALAGRALLAPPALPALPYDDVLPPSRVQVLVDAAGAVTSLVLLPPESVLEAEARPVKGDTNALRLARSLRFAPAAQATLGEVDFNWQTVPPANPATP